MVLQLSQYLFGYILNNDRLLLTIAAEYLHSVERRQGSLHAFVRLRGRRRYPNTVGIKVTVRVGIKMRLSLI